MSNKSLQNLSFVLNEIRDGADFVVEHLYEQEYMVLIENLKYAPDNGEDPKIGFTIMIREP